MTDDIKRSSRRGRQKQKPDKDPAISLWSSFESQTFSWMRHKDHTRCTQWYLTQGHSDCGRIYASIMHSAVLNCLRWERDIYKGWKGTSSQPVYFSVFYFRDRVICSRLITLARSVLRAAKQGMIPRLICGWRAFAGNIRRSLFNSFFFFCYWRKCLLT